MRLNIIILKGWQGRPTKPKERKRHMLNLKGLKHSRTSNIMEGRISNQDAILLGIAEGMSSTEIRAALKEWRGDDLKWGKSHLLWYFNLNEGTRLEPVHKPLNWPHEAWYRRVGRGRYELTKAGWRRIAKIHGVPMK